MSQHSSVLASTHLVSIIYKRCKSMFLGVSRAVLGAKGCEIEWTGGIQCLVLTPHWHFDITAHDTSDHVSLLFSHTITNTAP